MPQDSEESSIIENMKPHALQRGTDEVRAKGGSKSEFVAFVNKNQFKSNKVCYKVSLCENL